VSYGYRVGEVELPEIGEVKDGTKFMPFNEISLADRPLIRASLGPHLEGAARPVPDTNDPANMIAGSAKRFCTKPPVAIKIKLRRLKRFVQKWVKKNLVPLAADTDVTFETWIRSTDYTDARKDELRRKYAANPDMKSRRNFLVKMFLKDESYPEYKHARGINSRMDEFKVCTGPIFKAIEKQLFSLPYFIKKVPVSERPAYLLKKLGHGHRWMATDYSSFEALFTRELMLSCEFVLYEYMTQLLPDGPEWYALIKKVIAGENHIKNKYFEIFLEATRMSGEMNTSLGNSFSNLMFMLFLSEECGATDVEGTVEGDDGLFTLNGDYPTAEQFAELGLTIKIDMHDKMEEASFCGLIYDRVDLVNVTDPIKVLQTFGWTTRQYARSCRRRKMELLRCKALSVAYQYNGCPILMALARYGLRVTEGFRARIGQTGVWERSFLQEVLKQQVLIRDVPEATRMLVESKFGITIEHQLRIEEYLDGLTDVVPLNNDLILMYSHRDAEHYWHNYVRRVQIKSKLINEPTFGSNSLAIDQLAMVSGGILKALKLGAAVV
jgi:hypothetical protein